MQFIDLDGDGKKEYVVAYLKDDTAGVDLYYQYLSNFDYITYMDIDNDGNMEIIIDIPVASSYFRYGIYKYEDNSIKGRIDIFGIGG